MFIAVPLEVDDMAVDRLPLVSISIAALCFLVFLFTWVFPPAARSVEGDLRELTDYYSAHPYLELPGELRGRLLSNRQREKLDELHEKFAGKPVAGGAEQQAKEQEYLDELGASIVATLDANPLRRYALVAARGLFQPGWLTSLFLHYGWLHLIGNLLFFYIAGPLLEDVWGRRFFLPFYLAGGLVAGAAQVLIEHGSQVGIAGASGAIAACMGAFTLRFSARRVRMGYVIFFFLRLVRGTFFMPAWLWGASWFLLQLVEYVLGGGHGGVAVMAHLGGFAFGACVAFAVDKTGYERRVLQPRVEEGIVYRVDDPLSRAQDAEERSDFGGAKAAWRALAMARPGDREAVLGLARMELRTNEKTRGLERAERWLRDELRAGNAASAWEGLGLLGDALDVERLSAAMAQSLLDAASFAPAPFFLTRANALRSAAAREPAPAVPSAPSALPPAHYESPESANPAALAAPLQAIPAPAYESPAAPPPARASTAPTPRPSAAPPPGPSSAAPRSPPAPERGPAMTAGPQRKTLVKTWCTLVRVQPGALELRLPNGETRVVPLESLAGIGAAMIPAASGKTIVTDFVLRLEPQIAIARVSGPQLQLALHFPGVPPREAHRKLLALALANPAVRALPDRASLERGEYPAFANEAALDLALYSCGSVDR